MAQTIGGIDVTLPIHKDTDIVTTLANIANALTPIFTIEPNANQIIFWPAGNVLQLKLYDNGGIPLENGAELSLYKVGPGGRGEQLLGTKVYASWLHVEFGKQFDPDRAASLTIPFHEIDAVAAFIPHGWRLELRLKSALVVDWTRADVALHVNVGEEIITV